MNGTFSIASDPARELVRIRLSGFFSADDIVRFQTELGAVHRRLGCGHKGGPLTLTDVGTMTIQSQEVLARWGAFLADPAHRSRRLAFVTGSSLARMQLQRAIGSRDAQVFKNEADAHAWLFATEASAAA